MDEQKELEKLMDKIFDADQLDVPSSNFTTRVIQAIEAPQTERLTYRPLLPKWVFYVMSILVTVFIYVVFEFTDASIPQVNYFNSMDISASWLTESISSLNFSNSFAYGILALGLLICLQARLLNGLLDRTDPLA